MKTRVSLALSGLGVTVHRKNGSAVDLLLTRSEDGKLDESHEHFVTLVVPKRHFGGATRKPDDESKDHVIFNIKRKDVRLVGMPSGAVEATKGLRKEIGGGKRQESPETVDAWRDVTWAVDFDHIEQTALIKDCLSFNPPKVIAARVHLTGGRLEAGLPRNFCLRSERWILMNAGGFAVDQQVVADTMYHVWDTDLSGVTINIEHFNGVLSDAVSLVAVGGIIGGVIVQSRPQHAHDKRCGEGEIDHYEMLYGAVTAHPGSITLAPDQGDPTAPDFRVDENKRCGRGFITEAQT